MCAGEEIARACGNEAARKDSGVRVWIRMYQAEVARKGNGVTMVEGGSMFCFVKPGQSIHLAGKGEKIILGEEKIVHKGLTIGN